MVENVVESSWRKYVLKFFRLKSVSLKDLLETLQELPKVGALPDFNTGRVWLRLTLMSKLNQNLFN